MQCEARCSGFRSLASLATVFFTLQTAPHQRSLQDISSTPRRQHSSRMGSVGTRSHEFHEIFFSKVCEEDGVDPIAFHVKDPVTEIVVFRAHFVQSLLAKQESPSYPLPGFQVQLQQSSALRGFMSSEKRSLAFAEERQSGIQAPEHGGTNLIPVNKVSICSPWHGQDIYGSGNYTPYKPYTSLEKTSDMPDAVQVLRQWQSVSQTPASSSLEML